MRGAGRSNWLAPSFTSSRESTYKMYYVNSICEEMWRNQMSSPLLVGLSTGAEKLCELSDEYDPGFARKRREMVAAAEPMPNSQ